MANNREKVEIPEVKQLWRLSEFLIIERQDGSFEWMRWAVVHGLKAFGDMQALNVIPYSCLL